MRLLFFLFLLVPIAEIYLLIRVGSVVGSLWTVALVVLTALIGAWLVRNQGIATWNRVQSRLDQGELPAMEMIEGMCLLIAGALLLTPGFVTDGVGFALTIAPLRRAIITRLIDNGVFRARTTTVRYPGDGQPAPGPAEGTIEGEYRRLD